MLEDRPPTSGGRSCFLYPVKTAGGTMCLRAEGTGRAIYEAEDIEEGLQTYGGQIS